MEKSADYNSPYFVFIVEPGRVFILKLIERAVPSDGCLFFGIIITYENDKGKYVDYGQTKCNCFYCHSWKEYLSD
jgi:hypothetical protein